MPHVVAPAEWPESVRIAGLWLVAAVAALAIGPRGPVYWDTFGYLTQALTGQVGGLGLGRPVFVFVSHALTAGFLGIGGSVWSIEPLLRGWWIVVASAAAPAVYRLAWECGLSRGGAMIAGLGMATSPAMAHTSAALLTDAPAVAVSACALALGARAVRVSHGAAGESRRAVLLALLAGTVGGCAVGLREQSVMTGLALALMLPAAARAVRWRLGGAVLFGAAVTAVVPLAIVAATQPGYSDTVIAWWRAMRQVRGADPGMRALAAAGWLIALGPVLLVGAGYTWTRQFRSLLLPWRTVSAVCVVGLLQLILLVWYPDITYSPRYLLPALPGALAIPAALAWSRASRRGGRHVRTAVVLAALLSLAAVRPLVGGRERALHDVIAGLPGRLDAVPTAAVVTGQPCPAIPFIAQQRRFARGGAAEDGWTAICPGWAWPANLSARLDAIRAAGGVVVLDLRPTAWMGDEQSRALAEAVHYAETDSSEGSARSLVLWR